MQLSYLWQEIASHYLMFRTLKTQAWMHWTTHSDIYQSSDSEDFHENKQLTQCQVNYLDILFKFNFQIIFWSGKINTKVNALIRMSLIDVSESTQRTEDRYQIILTLNRINISTIESEVVLYQRVKDVNKMNELCNEYKQAIRENKLKLHSIELKHCKIIDNIVFKKDLLWVSENMHTKLLKKIHDQSFIFHSDNQKTTDLVQCFYY